MDSDGRDSCAWRPAVFLRRLDYRRLLRRMAHAEDYNVASSHRNAYSGDHYEKRRSRQF